MCRSIKTLRLRDETATDEEVRAAALQFVRKISGYRVPSRVNETAFDGAVEGRHPADDTAAFERGTGGTRGGHEAISVPDDELGVGSDVHEH